MKLPNSYGSVIKLGGKRRKPYAVRISKLVEDDTGKVKRKYTYLAYFSKPEMAYTYLAEYNSGAVVPEHMKYSDSPTFAEMYEKWKKYLINNKFGNHYTYGTYMNGNFNTCMGKLKMKHLPHDGRHTFASLMDNAGANDVCIKLIMGHSMKNDTTKGTYTHKTLEELLTEVNKI